MHKIRMRSEKAYHEDVMSALVRLDDAEHAGPRSSDVESSTLERRGTGEKATLGGGMKNMFTAIKRYYNNTFTDQDKQFAMHLALGVYEPYFRHEEMPLWNAGNDALYAQSREQDAMVHPLKDASMAYHWIGDAENSAVHASWDDYFDASNGGEKIISFDAIIPQASATSLSIPYRSRSVSLASSAPSRFYGAKPLATATCVSVSSHRKQIYHQCVSGTLIERGVPVAPVLVDDDNVGSAGDVNALAMELKNISEQLRAKGILDPRMSRRRSTSA